MILTWLSSIGMSLVSDTHGAGLLPRLYNIKTMPDVGAIPSTIGVIILGDLGLNYYLDSRDEKLKKQVNALGFQLYCVRGNHEARPQDVKGMEEIYDENVHGMIYYEPQYPNIKYFKDFGAYQISRYKVGVIGGAYSVDKEYRLLNGWQWFPNEQLSYLEQDQCYNLFKENDFDLILTHTCPYDWRPTDLFLSFIDQSKVDSSMEEFLNNIKEITTARWAFGHYHDDRLVRPGAIMLYHKIISLDEMMGNHMELEGFAIDPKYNE